MLSDSYLDMYPYSYPYSSSVCNQENVEDCIIHLNKLLQNMCLPTISNMSNITVPLVNITFDLLKRIQQDTKFREELESKTSRIITDYERLQTSQMRLKDDIEKLEREIAIRQGKEKELATKNRSLCSSIKAEKDEVKRLNSTINHRELQYRHDSKKNEREMNRLKEKLSQVLMEKSHKILGPEILNALPKTDGKRATWKTNSNQVEEFYSMMLRDYEKKLKSLHAENHDLENFIEKIVQTLESLVEQFKFKLNSVMHVVNEVDSESDAEEMDVAEGKSSFNPSESGYETCVSFTKCQKLLQKLNRYCTTLHNYLENNIKDPEKASAKTLDAEQESELDLLKTKLQQYKELVAFQEETLQKFAKKAPTENSSNSFLHETQLIQEYEQLEIKKKLFLEAKGNFEKERLQHLNEAMQLAEEKKLFNLEKCNQMKQQFLELTPKKNPAELLPALTDFLSATTSSEAMLDSYSTPNTETVFKNSTSCHEHRKCKNLASGDAAQMRNHQRNSLLDYSDFILDKLPYSLDDSRSNSSSSNPVNVTPKCQSYTSLAASNHSPCSSASAPSGLNSEESSKICHSSSLFQRLDSSKILDSGKILSSKALRNHFSQRRRSDPVCSMNNMEVRNLAASSLHSCGELSHKTHFVSLNSLNRSLCLQDQQEPQFQSQTNFLQDFIDPFDL
ncbi:afadin- and alpha-actinin-binding protein A isoform X2 [Octopus bimaculoides]|uniref:Uncharacterized protein n=2 Tax=Octopus bimaculoides TaxID=37653 RepID=A0A0L8HRV2_OCTBM|nr:afadin- and alpha-actinin-binding protein A isoform X2 [Octopus bimaculoides]XP_052831893.1 afadin- and alpha-actinin-binding protein A isoform X2 [Octopus bimaculoides]XP_052831894.1 afadin- and alpha-actinin-binding protein A isoform X2 [Octopus bimaculoides]XP_052831895.1 afadin- and alpha-actinin-binding protein A isoform X2 [Octopus bimaculoides]|eukprot:XP_014769975.1 PREDICTED: afadin- and alpha-actinin-binding protein A-like [Octopus bimaculoides]